MHLILNEPQAHQELLQQPAELIQPIIKNQNFVILPLTKTPLLSNLPPPPNRHPTYLLNNFPHRPHYYQPDSTGAQAGYCLSPIPPCLRQFINSSFTPSSSSSSSTTDSISPPHYCPSRPRFLHNTSSCSSHFAGSSAALSSLPSLSTTVASSSSLSPLLSSSSISKPSEPISRLRSSNTLEKHRSPIQSKFVTDQQFSSSSLGTSSQVTPRGMVLTKKVLPIPPSLSPRIRQIFVDKIGSQQAQSCAQLPRRKKKKPVVEPTSPPL